MLRAHRYWSGWQNKPCLGTTVLPWLNKRFLQIRNFIQLHQQIGEFLEFPCEINGRHANQGNLCYQCRSLCSKSCDGHGENFSCCLKPIVPLHLSTQALDDGRHDSSGVAFLQKDKDGFSPFQCAAFSRVPWRDKLCSRPLQRRRILNCLGSVFNCGFHRTLALRWLYAYCVHNKKYGLD